MCCASDCKTIEHVQERALHYVLNDFNDTYSNLLHTASKRTFYLAGLRIFAIEILKTLNDVSTLYMKYVLFKRKLPID